MLNETIEQQIRGIDKDSDAERYRKDRNYVKEF